MSTAPVIADPATYQSITGAGGQLSSRFYKFVNLDYHSYTQERFYSNLQQGLSADYVTSSASESDSKEFRVSNAVNLVNASDIAAPITKVYYTGPGSGPARASFLLRNELDFSGSDATVTASDYSQYSGLRMVPTVAAAVVPVYNIPSLASSAPSLIFSRPLLARIFLGDIQWWNHTDIVALNPGLSLPAERIQLVTREDSAGTTETFTKSLQSFLPEFGSRVRPSTAPSWCEGNQTAVSSVAFGSRITCNKTAHNGTDWSFYKASGTEGIAVAAKTLPNSLSFLVYIEAKLRGLKLARLINKAGSIVEATHDAVTYTLLEAEGLFDTDWNVSLVDTQSLRGWPITGFTFFVFRTTFHIHDCATRMTLLDYLTWFYTSPSVSSTASELGYASLGEFTRKIISQEIAATLRCVPGCNGTPTSPCNCANPQDSSTCPLVSDLVAQKIASRKIHDAHLDIVHHPELSPLISFIIQAYTERDPAISINLAPLSLTDTQQDTANPSTSRLLETFLDHIDDTAVIYTDRDVQVRTALHPPLSLSDDLSLTPSSNYVSVPLLAMPLGIIFNLGGTITSLSLSPALLSAMTLGTIRYWNHPDIAQLNPSLTLPSTQITFVVSSAGAGMKVSRFFEDAVLLEFLRKYVDSESLLSTSESLQQRLERLSISMFVEQASMDVVARVNIVPGTLAFIWMGGQDSLKTANLVLPPISPSVATSIFSISSLPANPSCLSSLSLIDPSSNLGTDAGLDEINYVRKYNRFEPLMNLSRAQDVCWPMLTQLFIGTQRSWGIASPEEAEGSSTLLGQEALVSRQVTDLFSWIAQRPTLDGLSSALQVLVMPAVNRTGTLNDAVKQIQFAGLSVANPQRSCNDDDIQVTISDCRLARGDMAVDFSWRPWTINETCIGGEDLPTTPTSIPCDFVPFESGFGNANLGLAIVGTVICLGFLAWTFYHRRARVVVISQRLFLYCFIVGAACLNLSSLTLVNPRTNTTCSLSVWLLSLSFSLMFAPLLMKLRRAYAVISHSNSLKRKAITNARVAAQVAMILGVDLLILSLWQIITPIRTQLVPETISGLGSIDRTVCDYGETAFMILLVVWKVVLVVWGVILSIMTWNLSLEYAEAKTLALANYNIILMGGLTLLIIEVIGTTVALGLILKTLTIFSAATVSVTLVMGVKVYQRVADPKMSNEAPSVQPEYSSKKSGSMAASKRAIAPSVNVKATSMRQNGAPHPSNRSVKDVAFVPMSTGASSATPSARGDSTSNPTKPTKAPSPAPKVQLEDMS